MSHCHSIAIIGSGISGTSAAYLLKDKYDVTVFEKNDYFGGHSNTIDIPVEGKNIPVDTGFIVFNKKTYPHLVSFFEHLEVKMAQSDMSFGVSIDNGALEYSGSSLDSFFAQRKNIFNPKFIKMGMDILKFNKIALKAFDQSGQQTIDELLALIGVSPYFKQWYLYPMAGAIWSTSTKDIGQFPAKTMLNFFENHGLLTIADQPQWYTLDGGSRTYIEKALKSTMIKKHLNTQIETVIRNANGVEIITNQGEKHRFDSVIFASPPHKTLPLLDAPTQEELEILSQFKFTKNLAYLHQDPDIMPKNKKAWASWSYADTSSTSMPVTYWMNKLQPLDCTDNIFVTLNPAKAPREELTHKVIAYEHPLFDQETINAQQKIHKLQGNMNTWYCGAYQRYGFHEDGIHSSLKVVNAFGVKAPWQ